MTAQMVVRNKRNFLTTTITNRAAFKLNFLHEIIFFGMFGNPHTAKKDIMTDVFVN